MRVLVTAPHTDDEINCAGLIARYKREKAQIFVAAFSSCDESLPKGFYTGTLIEEFHQSLQTLEADGEVYDYPVRRFSERRQRILDALIYLRTNFAPDLVLCPSATDMHQDHQVIYTETLRAFRNSSMVLGWESPNNQRAATINTFALISDEDLQQKLKAFACYKSQHHRTYFDNDFIAALALVRGKQCRSKTGLAEGYEVISQCL